MDENGFEIGRIHTDTREDRDSIAYLIFLVGSSQTIVDATSASVAVETEKCQYHEKN